MAPVFEMEKGQQRKEVWEDSPSPSFLSTLSRNALPSNKMAAIPSVSDQVLGAQTDPSQYVCAQSQSGRKGVPFSRWWCCVPDKMFFSLVPERGRGAAVPPGPSRAHYRFLPSAL